MLTFAMNEDAAHPRVASADIVNELQHVFPNIYASRSRANMNHSAAGSSSRGSSLDRIRRGMRNSTFQTALEQPCTPQYRHQVPQHGISSRPNIPLVSPRMPHAHSHTRLATPRPPVTPLPSRRGGSGIGISRLLSPSQPVHASTPRPATTSNFQMQSPVRAAVSTSLRGRLPQTSSADHSAVAHCMPSTSSPCCSQDHSQSVRGCTTRFQPYQIPQMQYHRMTQYMPSSIAARSSSTRRRTTSKSSGGRQQAQQWFTKTVVMVDIDASSFMKWEP